MLDGISRVRRNIAELRAEFDIPFLTPVEQDGLCKSWGGPQQMSSELAEKGSAQVERGSEGKSFSCQHHALYFFFWQTVFSNRCITVRRNLIRSRPCVL